MRDGRAIKTQKASPLEGAHIWLTLEEAALLYRVSARTLRRLAEQGEINRTNGLARIGRQYRLNRETFEQRFLFGQRG